MRAGHVGGQIGHTVPPASLSSAVRRRPVRLACLRALGVSVVVFTTEAQRPQRVSGSLAAGPGFLFVYFACFAVTFPVRWRGRSSLRVWRFWPENFESMNLGLPNQI